MKLKEIETHCHTKEVSPCSKISAVEIVRLYHQKGYHAVFITDHFISLYFEDNNMHKKSWEEKVDIYLSGYRAAKKEGDKLGLKILLGMEVQPVSSPYDFLVYGADEAFIKEEGPFYMLETKDFYSLMRKNGFIVFQAHPYRYGLAPENPKYYDGIEIFNAHPRQQSRNNLALKFAYEHRLWTIAGSDTHRPEDAGRSGVMMPEYIGSEKAFVEYYKTAGSPELIIISG